MRSWLEGSALLALVAGVVLLAGGCGQGPEKKVEGGKETPVKAKGPKEHEHGEWWCEEHGIPEAECSMCSARVEKECKAKGDWCEKHNRAKSQCFKCNPKLKGFFAAKYRAKYGKEPPPITEKD
jgi:hypothetical protein